MAGITTHVLDAATGKPGAGMRIDFSRLDGDVWRLVKSVATNADGRTDAILLDPSMTEPGTYEILFHVGEYFARRGGTAHAREFIDEVPVRFSVADATQHYHVPLLATPWSCATYRGS
jgi:5-hydroxyisourate hydrolase